MKYRRQPGMLLLEIAIALSIVGVLTMTLFPVIKPLQSLSTSQTERALADGVMQAAEGFAVTHGRLPCPAATDSGQESLTAALDDCAGEHGFVPWRTLGLPPAQQGWRWHVAGLSTLGAPLASTLTRPYAIRSIFLEQLSKAIFNVPSLFGTASPLGAPAYQLCDANAGIPAAGDRLCSTPPLGATAVLVLVPPNAATSLAIQNHNQTSQRLFLVDAKHTTPLQVRWLSYERLIWLWLQSGVLP
ncbi:MAG: type II secretion system protein [Burkholderiaceae bacterium]|jgi:hypothetical protein